MRSFTSLLVLLPFATLARSQETPVEPGSSAPALSMTRWIKGAPLPTLAKRGIDLVEFFEVGIPQSDEINERVAPLLTELAKANPDVTVVAVAVERMRPLGAGKPDVAGFVARLGDRIGYRVGASESMLETWVHAAAQNGLPVAFLVKDGTVMWVGNPQEVGEALRDLKSGRFDLAAERADFRRRAVAVRRRWAIDAAIDAALRLYARGDFAAGEAASVQAERDFPDATPRIEQERLAWLSRRDASAGIARSRELLTSGRAADRQAALDFAVALSRDPRLRTVARRTMEMALETKPDDLPTQLKAWNFYFVVSEPAAELRAIDRALALLPKDPDEDGRRLRDRLRERRTKLTGG